VPVHIWECQKHNFKIKGRLEQGKTISADLIVKNKMLFGVKDLPYMAHKGNRTLIFKIIRASIFYAYAGLQLTNLYRGCGRLSDQIILSRDRIRKNRQKQKSDL
jgi:hypothetical protein